MDTEEVFLTDILKGVDHMTRAHPLRPPLVVEENFFFLFPHFSGLTLWASNLASAKPLILSSSQERPAITKKNFIHLDANCLPNRADRETWPWSSAKLLF